MAIRITKVYTRHGDKGDTHLVGGSRVGKDDPRIESYGTIDELNAILGIVRAFNDGAPPSPATKRLDQILRQVQNELFDLGSELATPPDAAWEGMIRIGPAQIKVLERTIDGFGFDLAIPELERCVRDLGMAGAAKHMHGRHYRRRFERPRRGPQRWFSPARPA